MEFKDRLKAARRHAKLNQAELAVRAGITQTSISDLERGKSKATAHVAKIADVCGVHALWLSDGQGDMTAALRPIEPSNVEMVEQPSRMYRYPVVSWVAAGSWAEAVEPYPSGASDEYEISDYKAKGPAFWLTVKGDSMTATTAPSVPEGSQILVDTRADVRPGKLVIAKLADSNEATFKKLVEDGGLRYLKPLNPAYPTVQCSDDCKIIGVVVRSLTKFA
ncbi:LexA family protein [Pseudomonas savastanoi]|uniref:Repressor n=1 Tax=Pseudomonas savastanoi TaxID=29438 RepID=A0AAW3LY29_PSESS|nr:XRE family transcriptional regulator [Pseudomonas savastanoi]KTC59079.1 repressor [Pseudomonas savastanoi]